MTREGKALGRTDLSGVDVRAERGAVLHIGSDLMIESRPVQTHLAVASGGKMMIGDRVRIGSGCGISCESEVTLGDDVIMGPYVQIMDSDFHIAGNHDRRPAPRPVAIGEGVTLGAWVTVLPGSVVGAGASVLSGSVVSGTVPAGVTVAGNPATAHRTAASGAPSDLTELVHATIAEVLELSALPPSDALVVDLDGWTSLAALCVLVSLEQQLGQSLDERLFSTNSTVADLCRQVQSMGAVE